jgi:hypothetical protein
MSSNNLHQKNQSVAGPLSSQVFDATDYLNEAITKDQVQRTGRDKFMGAGRIEKENDSLRNQTVYLHQLIQMNEQKAGVNFISKNGVGTQRLTH